MEKAIANLVAHYSACADGSTALWPETVRQISEIHGVTPAQVLDAFAHSILAAHVHGHLDTSRASHAADDLHSAGNFSLPPFARAVFDALEYGECSEVELSALLRQARDASAA
jgi:hypothetical protein